MGAAAGEVTGVVGGVEALAAGGVAAASFLRELAERHVAAVQPERALRALTAAVAANPDDVADHARAAQLLVERGRLREALDRYGQVVRLDAARASAWEAIGSLSLDLGGQSCPRARMWSRFAPAPTSLNIYPRQIRSRLPTLR